MKLWTFGRKLPPSPPVASSPDWAQCRPAWIDGALADALSLPGGGWFVLDGSRALGKRPSRYTVAGHDLVAWRHHGQVQVGPDTCPHLGASLAEGHVNDEGCVVCPWHGLALGPRRHGPWRPLPALDDGSLIWVRMSADEGPLGTGETATDGPIITERPDKPIASVIRVEADCEPEDVLANRLDPWHGVHFHPHSFGRLEVIEQRADSITVRVVYKVVGRIGIEVDARFHCPDRRTIAMTIVAGEGTGSVVETHATPMGPGRTAIVEATLASSDRLGFALARRSSSAVRPLMQWAAHRLWREDAAYAERRYAIRTGRGRPRHPARLRVANRPDSVR